LDRRPEEECLGLLRESGIGVLARGALGKGLLAGKAAAPYLDRSVEEVEAAARAVEELAEGTTKADIAIRYVLENPAVTSVIAGARTGAQLEEILSGNGRTGLGKKELGRLTSAVSPNRYDAHR
ncbi:MAG TPA: aldo/keto reductase, partial [Puia sp.]